MRKIRKALREIEELKAARDAHVDLEKNQHEKITREAALREELGCMEHAIDIENARVCTCCGPDIKGLNNLTLEAPSREQSFVRRLEESADRVMLSLSIPIRSRRNSMVDSVRGKASRTCANNASQHKLDTRSQSGVWSSSALPWWRVESAAVEQSAWWNRVPRWNRVPLEQSAVVEQSEYPDPIKEKLDGRFRPRRAVRGALSPEEQDAWHAMFGGTTRPTSPVLKDGAVQQEADTEIAAFEGCRYKYAALP